MRKRYFSLFSMTFIIICGVLFSGSYVKSIVKNVNVMRITKTSIENTKNCSGTIEPSKITDVYANSFAIAEEIYTQVGQTIEKGDVIMTLRALDISDLNKLGYSANDLSSFFSQNVSNSNNLNGYDDILKQMTQQTNSDLKFNQDMNSNSSSIINVIAPVSGSIYKLNVAPEKLVSNGSVIACISESDLLQVHLSVNESQISDIQEGQHAVITGSGFKDSEYKGTVQSISKFARSSVPTLNSSSEAVVDVLISIDSESCNNIKPGFTAKCKITTGKNEDIFVLPYTSVLSDDDGTEYCYKYSDGVAMKTYIKTGKEFDEGFEVTDGISIGDLIILNTDTLNLKDRDKISVNYEAS